MTQEQYNHIVALLTEIRDRLPPPCNHVWGTDQAGRYTGSAKCIKCGFKP